MQAERTAKVLDDRESLEERISDVGVLRQRIVVRLVNAISRACVMHGSRSIRHLGLSMSQAGVLGELLRHNGCRQEDLRGFVSLDKGNVTRAVQHLERQGLVRRMQDAVDRRATRVYVTRKALAIESEIYALAAQWDKRLTVDFTVEERHTLVELLLRMEANARAMASDDGSLA